MAETTASQSIYVAYWLYKLDPAFHRLREAERTSAKAEFLHALEARPADLTLRGAYSLEGFRADADLMFWVHGPDLDAIQRLAVALRHTGLGRYLDAVETYVGVVTPARYDPGHQPSFVMGAPAKDFISVYPFVKTTEWYLLPYEKRRDLMAEHGLVGRHYAVSREKLLAFAHDGSTRNGKGAATATAPAPTATLQEEEEGGGVLANTVDSFGLGDYEFILANESDDATELCRMMESLRKVEVRRYTKLDTPIYLGRLRAPADALADL
jgi:hydrogen peroxide-dependent heme synthase